MRDDSSSVCLLISRELDWPTYCSRIYTNWCLGNRLCV